MPRNPAAWLLELQLLYNHGVLLAGAACGWMWKRRWERRYRRRYAACCRSSLVGWVEHSDTHRYHARMTNYRRRRQRSQLLLHGESCRPFAILADRPHRVIA